MRRFFEREEDWEAYWRSPTERSFGLPAAKSGRGKLDQAGKFLAATLRSEGFRLFENGGIPLLERRRGPYHEEIVLRAAPFRPDEAVLPIKVDIHLSHEGMPEVRWPYWRLGSRIPVSVVAADLGALGDPAGKLVWTMGETSVALEDMAQTVVQLALPWYAHFRWPWELCDALFARQVPLIDHATSVELILAEFGPREARRYLLEHMVKEERFVKAMEGSDRPLEPDEACADPFRKLANIAQLCHLV